MYGIGRNEWDVVSFAIGAFGKNSGTVSIRNAGRAAGAALSPVLGSCDPAGASSPTEVLRAGHLSMAAGWHSLAIEVELSMGRFDSVAEEFDSFPGYALRPAISR